MKCPKCKNDMQRVSEQEHQYFYRCTRCRYTIGKTDQEEKKPEQVEVEDAEN